MEENTQADEGTLGRSIQILAFGDTADEIELYALDKARSVLGADIRLCIERSYRILDLDPSGALAIKMGTAKGWYATVTVRECVQ